MVMLFRLISHDEDLLTSFVLGAGYFVDIIW